MEHFEFQKKKLQVTLQCWNIFNKWNDLLILADTAVFLSPLSSPSSHRTHACNKHVLYDIILHVYLWIAICYVLVTRLVIKFYLYASTVASPGFVARRGKDGNYLMGHSRWTSRLGAAAARWLIVLWLMQYWSKELLTSASA